MTRPGYISHGEKIAAKRRADSERQRRCRQARRESGLPTQAAINTAVVEALAWAAARSVSRPLKPSDAISGELRIDIGLVISRAIMRLTGDDPRTRPLEDRQRTKRIARLVYERIATNPVWWVGSWSIRSRPSFTSASPSTTIDAPCNIMGDPLHVDGNTIDSHGVFMDDDFEGIDWPWDDEIEDGQDDFSPNDTMEADGDPMDTDG